MACVQDQHRLIDQRNTEYKPQNRHVIVARDEEHHRYIDRVPRFVVQVPLDFI